MAGKSFSISWSFPGHFAHCFVLMAGSCACAKSRPSWILGTKSSDGSSMADCYANALARRCGHASYYSVSACWHPGNMMDCCGAIGHPAPPIHRYWTLLQLPFLAIACHFGRNSCSSHHYSSPNSFSFAFTFTIFLLSVDWWSYFASRLGRLSWSY